MNVALCIVNVLTVGNFSFNPMLFGLGRVGKGEQGNMLHGIHSKFNMLTMVDSGLRCGRHCN